MTGKTEHPTPSEPLDLAVVGAGPCGLAVGCAARKAGLRALHFDKGCITNSLVDYPYYMTFFSTAERLEIGGVPFTIPDPNPTRREALAYYRKVVEHFDLDVRQYHEVIGALGSEGAFQLRTRDRAGRERAWEAGRIVVATGSFHEPNYLGVPGEEMEKVRHYYKEPAPYWDQDVLVVGGGNSAVEAALELFRSGSRVTLAHFLDRIDPGVKPWVVPDITNRLEKGEIDVFWKHRVERIGPDSVTLTSDDTGETTEIANDFVLAMTGWRSDPRLLRQLGVTIDPGTGIPSYDPATMETDVAGVFVAGVLAAGHDANKIFIENGRHHGGTIVEAVRERLRREPEVVTEGA